MGIYVIECIPVYLGSEGTSNKNQCCLVDGASNTWVSRTWVDYFFACGKKNTVIQTRV